jgi:catechol 2,3-dioxygenase-like lactoylglutathione lyase family enzyme
VSDSENEGRTVTTIYTIDKKTAEGHDQNGNPVDLTKFKDGTPSDPDEPETYETGSFAYQRRLMKFEDALFGVRYMGADDPMTVLEEEPEHLAEILNNTGTGEALGLYIGYPEENVVQTRNGKWLYFIIPRSSDCKVEVKTEGDDGETIYSGDGAPIILKCGGYYPDSSDCTVYITDPDGNTISWRPRLIGDPDPVPEDEYGHIDRHQADGLIHDFSDYNYMQAMG